MRLFLIAATCALVACGGSQSSQANNTQANAPGANVTASAAVAASVSGAKAAAIMHERHEGMESLGKAMRTLHRELESGHADIAVVRQQTATMAAAAAKIPGWFPPGTGPDAGKTRAKAEVWTQHDLFARKAKDFQSAARLIDAAAKSGDLNKVMASHDAVDQACDGCHKPFRAPGH